MERKRDLSQSRFKGEIYVSSPMGDLSRGDLERVYLDERKGIEGVAQLLGVRYPIARFLMNQVNIPILSRADYWNDPTHRQKRMAAINKVWQDPTRKLERIAEIHTPESRIKRIESLRRFWQQNPDKRKQQFAEARKILLGNTRERMEQVLGDDPKARLEELYRDQRLSAYEIAARFEVSLAVVYNWMKHLGVKTRKAGIEPGESRLNTSIQAERKAIVDQGVRAGVFEQLNPAKSR